MEGLNRTFTYSALHQWMLAYDQANRLKWLLPTNYVTLADDVVSFVCAKRYGDCEMASCLRTVMTRALQCDFTTAHCVIASCQRIALHFYPHTTQMIGGIDSYLTAAEMAMKGFSSWNNSVRH